MRTAEVGDNRARHCLVIEAQRSFGSPTLEVVLSRHQKPSDCASPKIENLGFCRWNLRYVCTMEICPLLEKPTQKDLGLEMQFSPTLE